MKNLLLDFIGQRRIGVFGPGRSNMSLLELLSGSSVDITVRSDKKTDLAALPAGLNISKVYEGERSADAINEELIFFSPSVRRDRKEFVSAKERGVSFSSDVELFLKYNTSPLFTVTGSGGKTTTTELSRRILCAGTANAKAIGNIGVPAFESLSCGDAFVLEVSSFMLMYAKPKSKRALITSLYPNHLNWHKDYCEYKNSKLGILRDTDEAVISLDSDELSSFSQGKSFFALTSSKMSLSEMKSLSKADLYYHIDNGFLCVNGQRLINKGELIRQEDYNVKNYLNALALTHGYADEEKAMEIIQAFGGIEHRGEIFFSDGNVRYINSSIDTSAERTKETLNSLGDNLTVLMGGRSKGEDISLLCEALKVKAKNVLLFGESGKEMKKIVPEGIYTLYFKTLREATKYALENIKSGDIVLSPAATSYDEFSSFEERGSFFKNVVLSEI